MIEDAHSSTHRAHNCPHGSIPNACNPPMPIRCDRSLVPDRGLGVGETESLGARL
jgi:hypothetical protein